MMKTKVLTICAVVGLILGFTTVVSADADLFNDEDRATIKVRSDTADDYGYDATLYPDMRRTVADGWSSISLPFAGNNTDGTAFDVARDYMETMRFYLIGKDSYFNDGDDPQFQVDNLRLTRTVGADLVIDNFDDGNLRWSYQQHTAPSSPPGGVATSLVDVAGRGKVLDIAITDVDARDWGTNWEMNYIDIFTCLTSDARDSSVYGADWSGYDNLEYDWRVLDPGTRRTYLSHTVRTDVVPEPATLCLLGLGGLGLLRRRKRA